MQDCFYLIDDYDIKEKAYDYLLSFCDKVRFLVSEPHIDASGEIKINNAEQVKECFISCGFGNMLNFLIDEKFEEVEKWDEQLWGMRGVYFTFALSEDVKKFVKGIGLFGMKDLQSNDAFAVIQNLTLFENNNILFSCCSHEEIDEIDGNFRSEISNFCKDEIKKTSLFINLKEKFKENLDLGEAELAKRFCILAQIDRYVAQDWNAVIRVEPDFEILFDEYAKIAKEFLSNSLALEIEKAGSFKALFEIGYPQTFDEVRAFNNKNTFVSSELYSKIFRQLNFIQMIFKENGLNVI